MYITDNHMRANIFIKFAALLLMYWEMFGRGIEDNPCSGVSYSSSSIYGLPISIN